MSSFTSAMGPGPMSANTAAGIALFLIRRGFPAGLVQDRLRVLWPRWGDALEGLEPAEEPEIGDR